MPTASDFIGAWDIARTIADKSGGPDGRFAGQATFHPRPDGWLDYVETGTLTVGDGTPMRAERRYLWRVDGQGAEVRFADGRPFHAFDWDGARATHPCGDDTYRVRYDFSGWPEWIAAWDVTGPRKDYRMVTRHRPTLAGGPRSGDE